MSLIAIKAHMMTVKRATLVNLCVLFNADAEQLRCMLSHWIRKGKLRQCVKKSACGSTCFGCPSATSEMYEWIGDEVVIMN